jgi:FkbM family methyltransferase
MNKPVWLDIGCNKGYYLSRWCGNKDIMIYAFEPNPELYENLLSEYKDYENVKILPFAIHDEDGSCDFYISENPSASSLKKYDYSDEFSAERGLYIKKTILVETKRIDTFLNENNITEVEFIKSDTQGNDFNVIKSLGDKISIVKRIMVEAFTGGNNLYENEGKENEITEYMISNNFYLDSKSQQGNYADLVFKIQE